MTNNDTHDSAENGIEFRVYPSTYFGSSGLGYLEMGINQRSIENPGFITDDTARFAINDHRNARIYLLGDYSHSLLYNSICA